MKTLIAITSILVCCSGNAYAWEYVHPTDGYKACMYRYLKRNYNWKTMSKEERTDAIGRMHNDWCR